MTAVNAITEKLLNELIAKYKTETSTLSAGENIELEIRFHNITREVFEALYAAIKNNKEFAHPVLECSVNVISENIYERNLKPDETQYIRKGTYNKGVLSSDKYILKTRLARSVHMTDYIKYSIGLAKESETKSFSTSSNPLVRFKLRTSFDFIGAPPRPAKWRFDLTAVKHGELKSIGNDLKRIKMELFTEKLSAETFLHELNFDIIDSYEVEIEYIDKDLPSIEDLTIAKKMFTLINPQYTSDIAYQDEIYHIAEYIITNHNILHLFKQPGHRLKQLSNQVITLSKNTYYAEVYPPNGMFLTEKIDGERAVISIDGNRCRILKSDSMIEEIKGHEFVSGEVTIADSEILYDSAVFTAYIFDVMVFRNENVSKEGFATRVGHIADATALIAKMLPSGCKAQAKRYIRLGEGAYERGFREVYEEKYPYKIDGLILTEPAEPYHTTKNYKWKPYASNTIDFLAIKCPQKLLGIKPYEVKKDYDLYLLFVGIGHQMREKLGIGLIPQYRTMLPRHDGNYYPIQFSSSANPLAYIYYHKKGEDLDHQIIELSRNAVITAWIFHRVRADRKMEKTYYGNDFRTAELTYMNYIDPFSFEDLWTPSGSYFTKRAADMYTGSLKFKRFVISVVLKDNLSGSKWIIDEGAGRGADLHRYQEIGVENALFIDIDPTAIAELIRRKFSFAAAKKRHIRQWFQKEGGDNVVTTYDSVHDIEYDKLIVKDVKSLTVHTLVADLKSPYQDLIASTYQYGINPGLADGVVCNFALHYMCDTIEHIRNLLIFNARMLKIGGLFMFTVMDGKSVFELLKPLTNEQKWESKENNVLKYAITKKYTGDKITPAGQMIAVLLPFSDKMYDEPLCNVETVIKEARQLGFEVELNAQMNTMLGKFEKADRTLYERLTEEDRKYIALHKYVTLRLVRKRDAK